MRHPQRHRRLALVALAVAVLLAALPAAAYTIYLKDGSRMIARDKYQVKGDQAVFVLQNGTSTTIDLAEIDVARTEKANESNLGTAVVIEGGQTRDAPAEIEPEERTSLSDLARQRRQQGQRAPAQRPPTQRPPSLQPAPQPALPEADEPTAEAFVSTAAGYPDLLAAPRRPYADLDLVGDLKRFYNGQGIDDIQVFQGSDDRLPMVEITATSEASVFRAIAVTASALRSLSEQGRDVTALQLFLATPRGGPRGPVPA